MKIMTAEELRKYREKEHEKSYLLIDVRQPSEYEQSHIAGSILLPLNEFEEQVEELPEKNIIFYCRSGIRSKAAALTADFFNEAGKEIYTLEGGILSWNGFTVEGVPSFKTFNLNKSVDQLLIDAINLEKGACRFYEYVLKKFFSDRASNTNNNISEVMKSVKDGELGHARLIYSHLKKIVIDTEPFEEIYENLKGDILEGGATFEEIIKLIEKRTKQQTVDILETAISMEYRAFDLYRVMSERAEEDSIKEAFYSLAQAEKAHMNTLVKALEQSFV